MAKKLSGTKNVLSLLWVMVERAVELKDSSIAKFRSVCRVIDLCKAILVLDAHPQQADAALGWKFDYEDPAEYEIVLEDADFELVKEMWKGFNRNGFRTAPTAEMGERLRQLVLDVDDAIEAAGKTKPALPALGNGKGKAKKAAEPIEQEAAG